VNDGLKFEDISFDVFREYLKVKKDELKWFLWHLNNTSIEFKYQHIIQVDKIVGVVCFVKDINTLVDIYIDQSFRRNNIGSKSIKLIKHKNSNENLMFKVNKLNNVSLHFFDDLITKKVLVQKTFEGSFYLYK